MAKDAGPKGKLAARFKQVEKPKLCPMCGGVVEAVLYHPSSGRARNGYRCQKCNVIYLRVGKHQNPETVFLADEHHVTAGSTPEK